MGTYLFNFKQCLLISVIELTLFFWKAEWVRSAIRVKHIQLLIMRSSLKMEKNLRNRKKKYIRIKHDTNGNYNGGQLVLFYGFLDE